VSYHTSQRIIAPKLGVHEINVRPYPGKTPLNAAVGFYYTLNNKGRENTFGVKFTATFIKPTWLVH
jgi:hypothetical protein